MFGVPAEKFFHRNFTAQGVQNLKLAESVNSGVKTSRATGVPTSACTNIWLRLFRLTLDVLSFIAWTCEESTCTNMLDAMSRRAFPLESEAKLTLLNC